MSFPRCFARGVMKALVRRGPMNAAVVDSDVVSMLFKGDARAFAFRHITGRLLGISFMTLAELERWPLERSWGPLRKSELEGHLKRYAVLPVNRGLCGKWAEVLGNPFRPPDAWIAASALYYGVPLITNNQDDYSKVRGLTVLSA